MPSIMKYKYVKKICKNTFRQLEKKVTKQSYHNGYGLVANSLHYNMVCYIFYNFVKKKKDIINIEYFLIYFLYIVNSVKWCEVE